MERKYIFPIFILFFFSFGFNFYYLLDDRKPYFYCLQNDTIHYCLNDSLVLFNPMLISRQEFCIIKNFFSASNLNNDLPFYSQHFSATYNNDSLYCCQFFDQSLSYFVDCNIIASMSDYICSLNEI